MHRAGLWAITAGAGLLSAALAFLPTTFPQLAFFSYFVPLPLFLVGLGIGFRPLVGAGLLATAFVLLSEGPILTAEFFVFSFVGPAFLIHRALVHRQTTSGEVIWYSPSFLLRDLTLLAGIVMILALGAYLYFTQQQNMYTLAKNVLSLFDPQGHIKDGERLLVKLFPFLPGFFTFSWMFMILLNAAIAQGFLAYRKANLRPTPAFQGVQVPKSFIVAFALSLVLSFVGVGTLELLGKNAAITLSFPFFLSGLGIVHSLLHKTSFARLGLVIFYCALLLLLWPAFFVILLGMTRPWIENPMGTN